MPLLMIWVHNNTNCTLSINEVITMRLSRRERESRILQAVANTRKPDGITVGQIARINDITPSRWLYQVVRELEGRGWFRTSVHKDSQGRMVTRYRPVASLANIIIKVCPNCGKTHTQYYWSDICFCCHKCMKCKQKYCRCIPF